MKSKKEHHPAIWGFTTYFAEGLPYSIIRQITSLFLRDRGIALDSIGLTSLFGLPWILKFLWAPLLDRFGSKRQWLILMQAVLTLLFAATAIISPLPKAPQIIATLFFVASFFAATNDTAIDGYYLEALDSDQQATYVGFRVMSYRIAMIFGTGVIATIGTTSGWEVAFGVAAISLGVLTLFHRFYLTEPQKITTPIYGMIRPLFQVQSLVKIIPITVVIVALTRWFHSDHYKTFTTAYPIMKKFSFSTTISIILLGTLGIIFLFRNQIRTKLEFQQDSFYGKAFLTFIDRPKIGTIFTAIIFIRTGEFMLSSMVAPFFVDLGIKVHYGWITGTVGLLLSIAGALVGGTLIKKFTLEKTLWPFLLLQNVTNLIYMVVAFAMSSWLAINTGAETVSAIGVGNIAIITLVQAFDQFAGGLGTAVLMLLLMRLCVGEFKAAHYAIGTAFMNISGVFAGIFGGAIANAVGYGWFFGASFLFSIPGMIAVMLLPKSLIRGES